MDGWMPGDHTMSSDNRGDVQPAGPLWRGWLTLAVAIGSLVPGNTQGPQGNSWHARFRVRQLQNRCTGKTSAAGKITGRRCGIVRACRSRIPNPGNDLDPARVDAESTHSGVLRPTIREPNVVLFRRRHEMNQRAACEVRANLPMRSSSDASITPEGAIRREIRRQV